MRIPYSKAYRAFPELDRFSDAQCEGFVRLVKNQYRLAGFGANLIGMAVMLVVMTPGLAIARGLAKWQESSGWGESWRAWDWIVATGMLVSFGAGFLAVLMWFDRWMKRAILIRLRETKCPACAYSLLGLAVVDGGLRCPECGEVFNLAERGLTPEDLLSAVAKESVVNVD